MTKLVCPEKLAAFDARAAAAKATPTIDYVELLQLQDFSAEQQTAAIREFRLRGIDVVITHLKQTCPDEDVTALKQYLKQCPRIEQLAAHIMTYKESEGALKNYLPTLHKKV